MLHRQLLLFILLGFVHLFADENAIAAQIIDRAVIAFFQGERVNAWGEMAVHQQIIRHSSIMDATKDPHVAQFLIVSHKIPENISKTSVVFTTDYDMLEKNKRIVGAFFWQKGRPNILFIRHRLQKANLTLGHEFDKYIEDEL